MENEFHVTMQEGYDPTITILEGQALELRPPVQIKLRGNIHAVADFLDKRYNDEYNEGGSLQRVDPTLAVVSVVEEKMCIHLALDPENFYGTEIYAVLEFTPELEQFFINTDKQLTREQLVKLIRFNRRFFEPGQHAGILESYQRLQLSGFTELSVNSDTRGNKESAFKKAIDSQHIPTEFVLTLPVFKGFEPERFRVEVCLEATDASVRFWFESVELAELIETRKKEIFAGELVSCEGLVIIHK